MDRFTDAAVRSEYRVKTACGKAGTGYLFDTHALHRGTPQGPNDHSRTAVIAEYHELSKCSQVRELGPRIQGRHCRPRPGDRPCTMPGRCARDHRHHSCDADQHRRSQGPPAHLRPVVALTHA